MAYPCFRCIFCHELFASRKAANVHLDHYLPEYCSAHNTKLNQSGSVSHPVPAIRYLRSGVKRAIDIPWESTAGVAPLEGAKWVFVAPVVSLLSPFLPVPF